MKKKLIKIENFCFSYFCLILSLFEMVLSNNIYVKMFWLYFNDLQPVWNNAFCSSKCIIKYNKNKNNNEKKSHAYVQV